MDALMALLSFSKQFGEALVGDLPTSHTYLLFAAGHMYSPICIVSLTKAMPVPFQDNLHSLAQVCE